MQLATHAGSNGANLKHRRPSGFKILLTRLRPSGILLRTAYPEWFENAVTRLRLLEALRQRQEDSS